LIDLLQREWDADGGGGEGATGVATAAAKALANFALGWEGASDAAGAGAAAAGRGMRTELPRFSADQCVTLLGFFEAVLCGDDDELGSQAPPPENSLLDVAARLRATVQQMVERGAIVVTSAAPTG
jgi:hypothetical protein